MSKNILTAMVDQGLIKSFGEGRKAIELKAVHVNGRLVESPKLEIFNWDTITVARAQQKGG